MAIAVPASRILLAYKDYTLDNTTIITGTGWSASTVGNIASTQFSTDAIATSNSTSISIDLGSQLSIGIITIPKHSLGTNSTWRVRTSNNVGLLTSPGSVPVEEVLSDSGIVNVWPEVADLTDVPYSEYVEWAGGLTNTTAPSASLPLIDTRAQYIYIDLVDADNASYRLCKLTIGPYWRPTGGVSANWTISYKAKGATHKRILGGGVFFEDKARYKQLKFSCKNLTETEIFSQVAEIDKIQTTADPWIVLLDPSDTKNLHRLFMYGTNSKIFPAKSTRYGYFSKTYTIDEWL